MPRKNRGDQFRPDEVAVVHVMNRIARRAMLLGKDLETGRCYSRRKGWFDEELVRLAAGFGIDIIASTVLDNHFHLVLRSRPDIVNLWDDTEIARRWLYLCPTPNMRRTSRGPNEKELDSIRKVPPQLAAIRLRLSDISWWTRLMSQRIAQRANVEDETFGHFWADRFKSVCLDDTEAILACAVYVDLNLIRASIAETIELSAHSSIKCRLDALRATLATFAQERECVEDPTQLQPDANTSGPPDSHLAPVQIADQPGAFASTCADRCSDKGYLYMSAIEYIGLVDWTARLVIEGKRGSTPSNLPPVLQRLGITEEAWIQFAAELDELFSSFTGVPPIRFENERKRTDRSSSSKGPKLRFAPACAV